MSVIGGAGPKRPKTDLLFESIGFSINLALDIQNHLGVSVNKNSTEEKPSDMGTLSGRMKELGSRLNQLHSILTSIREQIYTL